MTTSALAVVGEGYKVTLTPDAVEQKARALRATATITKIDSEKSLSEAQVGIKMLTSMRSTVEQSRKAVKAPVIEVGRQIDAAAAEFVADLETEQKRLEKLVADHVAAEREKARRAAEEAARIEREKREAEHRAELERLAAENRRLQAERDAREATDRAAREEAQRVAREESAKAAEAARKAEEARQAAAAAQATQAAPAVKTKGISEEPDFEVVDAVEFFRSFPHLCTITVNRAPIIEKLKKTLKVKTINQIQIPGLRVFMRTRVRGL